MIDERARTLLRRTSALTIRRMARCCLAGLAILGVGAAPAPWVGIWSSAQMAAEPANALDPAPLDNATFRAIVHVSAGGRRIRVRLSNAFGTRPLTIDAAHLAVAKAPASADIVASSDRALTFSGQSSLTLPPGAEIWSDPVDLPIPAFSDLAVSLRFPKAPDRQTGHGDARATSFVASGNQVGALQLAGAKPLGHWYQLSAIAADAAPGSSAIVALGDSITDSYMSTVDGNDRWPDLLARRLHDVQGTDGRAVLNEGLGGNRVLSDVIGPRLLDRLDRDLFSLPGVKAVILLEGVNDLGSLTRQHPVPAADHASLVDRLIAAYRAILDEAHRRGIRVIGGTIMPYAGSDYYHPDAANEADRQALNRWIRMPGHFDGVIDFDQATRDPSHPDHLLAAYDSGDHIHPSVAGYHAMADAIPLDLLNP
jgi:lysophospholipase L1-like esterase